MEESKNGRRVLLEVKNLQTHLFLDAGVSRVIDGISFDIAAGETLGVVGESGCGKSLTALSIMRQIPNPPGRIVGGEILFEGKNLLAKSKAEMRNIRGGQIAMIFQEPMTSLNPVMTAGRQIKETLKIHQRLSDAEAKKRAVEMLDTVRIPLAKQRYGEYPHQLSGGMRQRVMIAMALACHPKLLICDEPTTALDVTVQAQVLNLIRDLQKSLNMSIMLITHDLGVVSQMADRVIVMYAGKIVEYGNGKLIFSQPLHPYTRALLESIPRVPRGGKAGTEYKKLYAIDGMVPNLLLEHSGCLFAPRCENVCPECGEKDPPEYEDNDGKTFCFRRLHYHDQ
jgi:oligopeptide/dipeptide ABC transporter ATP-binding protein